MESLVKFTLKQKVFINVVFVILVIAGIFALRLIPLENMPDVDAGRIFIRVVYFGASADDIENLVTKKIEDALDGLENVEYIDSVSYRNFSSVHIKLIDDVDYSDIYDEIRFRIQNAKKDLPEGCDDPVFTYVETGIWLPVIMVNLTGNFSQNSLKLYADELRSQIRNIPDVKDAEILGTSEKEFHVSLDPYKLRKLGITFHQVVAAIKSANTKFPTGQFQKEDREFMLDSGKILSNQQEVLDVLVRRDGDGNFIRVRDIVTSAIVSNRDPFDILSANGRTALRLKVTKEKNGNTLDISKSVKKVAKEFEKKYEKDGIQINFSNDSVIEINDSVKTLSGNLIFGMILVMVVLWFTLGFRNAMLTCIGVPFSFLCAILILKLYGMSLNTISLFSFVLLSGILVDDATVIIENVYRHMQMGKPIHEAVIEGSAEVMLPIISSVLTTILAFLPMLMMTGTTGAFFSVIPKTVTFALVASLIEALFILPVHILDWGPKKVGINLSKEIDDPFHHLRSGVFGFFWKMYSGILRILLNHKFLALTGTLILFIGSMAILILSLTGKYPLIKVKFFPGNYFRYHIALIMPVGTSLDSTDNEIKALSQRLIFLGEKQVQALSATCGHYEDQDYTYHFGNYYGEIIVTLPEEKYREFPDNPNNDPMAYLGWIREELKQYIDKKYANSNLKPKVKVFEEPDGPPTGKPINIRVSAITMDDALKTSDIIMNYMGANENLKDLIDLEDNRPDYQNTIKFLPNNKAAFEYGIMPGDITGFVTGILNGQSAGKYRTDGEEIDLMVRIARYYDKANPRKIGLSDPTDILDIPVVEHSKSPVLLRDIVTVKYDLEPTLKTRYKGRPTITITANIKSGSKLSPAGVQQIVNGFFEKNYSRFTGVTLSFGGEFESTSRSYASLTMAFFIAILCIYLVLASQFGAYVQPLIIISAVPFALIGVVLGLFITQMTFTVGSFLAIVGLAGMAVNNSILLIDFMNTRVLMGKDLRDAIIEACAARMRPVIITTVTTILGLLPMAIGIPNKSISWAPMAMAFVTGLTSATILTLLIVPVEYELFGNVKKVFKKRATKL
ncbi:MAG: efflux RND transporter permease subunit [Desulfobacterales bacterium]|nr:efflux RND transporter permease subunit [Desulfobacterales bacterium]